MGLRPTVKSEGNSSDSRKDNTNDRTPGGERTRRGSFGGGDSPIANSPTSPRPQREAWTARGQLLLNFHHAISVAINSPEMARKCSRIAEDMSRDGGPSHAPPNAADDYGAEAALIVDNKARRDADVRNKSLAAGLLSFAALRGGRGASARARRAFAARRAGASYRFEGHLRPSRPHAQPAVVELEQPSMLRRGFRLTFDATVSASIALFSGAYVFMPRPSAYIEDMAKLPLVEGKSVYAEMVCPPLLKEYRRVLEEYGGRWPVMRSVAADEGEKERAGLKAPQLTQEDVSLNIIRKFVENCSKRSKYERALLEERNALRLDDVESRSPVSALMRRITRRKDQNAVNANDAHLKEECNKLGTVSIPSPGIPENFSVNLDQEVYSFSDESDDEEVGS